MLDLFGLEKKTAPHSKQISIPLFENHFIQQFEAKG